MKGSGTGLWATRVSELGAALERAARHGDLAGAERTIQTLAALLAWLDSRHVLACWAIRCRTPLAGIEGLGQERRTDASIGPAAA
jgi:hypothetical protein